jgi:hypothetical protein
MAKSRVQVIEKLITLADKGKEVSFEDSVKQQYASVTGVLCTLSEENAHMGSTLGLRIEHEEIFPSGMDVALAQFNGRFSRDGALYPVEAAGKSAKVEVFFRDGGKHISYPYVLKLYLFCKE